MRLFTSRILISFVTLLAISLACSIGQSTAPAAGAPTVTLTNPLPGQTAPVGEPIPVNSTSVDADGIQRVELWVDGAPVRVDANPAGNSPYVVSQPWQSNAPGSHVILVKAFDAQGTEGQSQPVVITLAAAAQTLPESTPVAQVSPTPAGQELPPTWTPTPVQLPPTWTPTPLPPPPTWTPTPLQPANTPMIMCTPPPCKPGEIYYCPGVCTGGCGTQCATPTPAAKPPAFTPTGIDPHSIFKPVWEKPEVKDYLGYPTQAASDNQLYARQYFERGYLYWWQNRPNVSGLIWAVEMPQPGANQGFRWTGPYADTWPGGDPTSCDAARPNPNGPIRGFGKLWCDHPEIAQAIGGAREPEKGTGDSTNYGIVQFFQGGTMLYSSLDRVVWVLLNGGTWQRYQR